MGQLSCAQIEKPDTNLYRLTLDFNKQENKNSFDRSNSFSQKYEIGKYLKVGKNPKLDEMWAEKLNSFKVYDEPTRTSSNYRNSLSKPDNIKQFFQDCPLITQDYEYYMFRFFIQEKQGFKYYGLIGLPQKYRWGYWKVITLQKGIMHKKMDKQISEATYCIKKDINRTLINDVFKEEAVIDKLDYVLNNLANLYPKVGYCQGMNYIAALFLMVSGVQEKETVCVFAELLDSSFYMFNLLFQDDLPLLFIMEEIIMKLIQVRLPKVYDHFIQCNISPSIWISKILLSGFVYLFDLLDCVLFWDYIFIKGSVLGYTDLIISMVTIHQDALLTKDEADLSSFFNFQEQKVRCAEDIIKQALLKPIEEKEIRKIMRKTDKKLDLVELFKFFGKEGFEKLYQKFSNGITK
ncbi:unnamed protein product (macronuclear) [Paramecium tetraurelia]|uniref:Rab-GAP TBC domain-containing protein n=1 Tax=Paramecium tetraurelia TaxID=5888 RepID=A0DU01_PARTE|nr:uncharacterized protein GSPATT00020202001 [Paramecium tetraurelia]CAK86518.1 unnamed protein product [Paramecium tetraurelia]|eukprot:XP_001453915.1 hypothetical protein (macronuclear) [Paramecium tetraurelia strain d4-2]